MLNSHMNAPFEAISYIQNFWEQYHCSSESEIEAAFNPALKYIDTINDKDKLEMNLRTFAIIMILKQTDVRNLVNFLSKHYGNTLSKVIKLTKDVEDGQAV